MGVARENYGPLAGGNVTYVARLRPRCSAYDSVRDRTEQPQRHSNSCSTTERDRSGAMKALGDLLRNMSLYLEETTDDTRKARIPTRGNGRHGCAQSAWATSALSRCIVLVVTPLLRRLYLRISKALSREPTAVARMNALSPNIQQIRPSGACCCRYDERYKKCSC